MFSILNLITHSPQKAQRFTEVSTNLSMVSFYSQTLELISKYLKEVGCLEKKSMKLLQEYIRKVQNIDEYSTEYCRLHTSRMNFLDDLRFLIMSCLDDSPKADRKSLRELHSILHLISLINNGKLTPFCILNSWLNSNSLLDDEDVVVHAMRGNIGHLMKVYPENREAFEELARIESYFRNKKISNVKYGILKEDWVVRFGDELPKKIRNIFLGQNICTNYHWTEILCYKLAYGNDNSSISNVLEEIGYLIPSNDEIYFILINNFRDLIANSKGWTKLIYSLLYKFDTKVDIYESIIEIANGLLAVDWQVSLDYFSFTAYSNYYFDKIISGIEMNPAIFDFLKRYAVRNSLNSSVLFDIYAKSLILKQDHFNYLIFINSNNIKEFDAPIEFVRFLIQNLNELEIYFTTEFLHTDLGRYLIYLNKLENHSIDFTKEEVAEFIDHQYTSIFIKHILDLIVEARKIKEIFLIKCLDLILHKHKDLLLDEKEIVNYKVKMIEKLHSMIK